MGPQNKDYIFLGLYWVQLDFPIIADETREIANLLGMMAAWPYQSLVNLTSNDKSLNGHVGVSQN